MENQCISTIEKLAIALKANDFDAVEKFAKIINLENLENQINNLLYVTYHYENNLANLKNLGWSFQWDNAKSRFGQCCPNKKVIKISQNLAEANSNNFDVIKDTVLHEIAHALHWIFYKEVSHNWRWKNIAISIGCNGKRCYHLEDVDIEAIKSKYTLICQNCGKKFPRHKITKRNCSCPNCSSGKYNSLYKLVLIKNY
jgi:predicted SprT family Zn-dependent metalloprotease